MTDQNEPRREPSWLTLRAVRDVFLIIFAAICSWRLINAAFTLDLSSVDIQDVLNLLLALFSVGLSVAFYFKANETSNMFYDNVYKFTRDVSEILGRIEAGFGESLKNIDKSYSRVQQQMDVMSGQVHEAQSNVEKKAESVEQVKEQQTQDVTALLDRAAVAENEKEEILQLLQENALILEQRTAELNQAKNELTALQSEQYSRETQKQISPSYPTRALSRILESQSQLLTNSLEGAKVGRARSIFQRAIGSADIPKDLLAQLQMVALMTDEFQLTRKGYNELAAYLNLKYNLDIELSGNTSIAYT